MSRVSLDVPELKDDAWRSIHSRIRERDLDHPFVPSPWEAPWLHPGSSYFMEGREARAVDKFVPGWLFGDDDQPLKIKGRR